MHASTSFDDRCIQQNIRKSKDVCEIWMRSFQKSTSVKKLLYITLLIQSVEANKNKAGDLRIAKEKLSKANLEYSQAQCNLTECKRIFEKYHAFKIKA